MSQNKKIKTITQKIHYGEPSFDHAFPIDTDKMIKFIKKYGVDHMINNDCLLSKSYSMTFDQIDILFSYKPNLLTFYSGGWFLCKEIMNCSCKSLYILRKMIEQDDNFLLLTSKRKYFVRFCVYGEETYLEGLKSIKKGGLYVTAKKFAIRNRMIILLENHEKKYYTLFDISLKNVDLNSL